MANDNLYHGPSEFRLLYGGDEYVIREPQGWGDFMFKLKRNETFKGFIAEYTAEDYVLKFDDYSGIDVVRTAFNTEHVEAEVYLLFGFGSGVSFDEVFRAKLAMDEFEDFGYYVELGLVSNTKRQKFLNRRNIKADVNGELTMDNGSMVALNDTNYLFHSKVLEKKSIVLKSADSYNFNYLSLPYEIDPIATTIINYSRSLFSSLGLDFIDINELNDIYSYPDHLISELQYNINLLYIYKAKERGEHTINIGLILELEAILNIIIIKLGGVTPESTYDCIDSEFKIEVVLQVADNSEVILASYTDTDCATTELSTGTVSIADSFNYYIEQNETVKIFIRSTITKNLENFIEIDQLNFNQRFNVTVKQNSYVEIIGATETRYSEVGGMLIHECTDKLVESILGEKSMLKSNFLGRTDLGYQADGCASAYILTNGKKLRGLSQNDSHLLLTLDDTFKSLNAIFNIGVGFEKSDGKFYVYGTTTTSPLSLVTTILLPYFDQSQLTIYRIIEGDEPVLLGTISDISLSGAGTLLDPYVYQGSVGTLDSFEGDLIVVVEYLVGREIVRLEQIEYFFKDVLLYEVPSNLIDKKSIRKTPANEFIATEIIIGYEKFPEDELNSLDEFNTEHQYLTPIKVDKDKLELKSKFIASGYAIEFQRRIQFENTGNQSAQYDDDVFIVSVTKDKYEVGIRKIDGPEKKIYLKHKIDNLPSLGDSLQILGSASNNGTYTITNITEEGILPKRTVITVSESLTSEAYDSDFRILYTSGEYSPERAQKFELVEGIISPNTSYNLRLSPKRMLYNWAKWINSFLFYRDSGDILKNTFVKNDILDGTLTTRFADSEQCLLGDQDRVTMIERSDVTLAELNGNRKLFKPNKYEFNCQLPYEDVLEIIDKHYMDTDESYGYIGFTDYEGNLKYGWILEMDYNPITEKVKFVLIEKA